MPSAEVAVLFMLGSFLIGLLLGSTSSNRLHFFVIALLLLFIILAVEDVLCAFVFLVGLGISTLMMEHIQSRRKRRSMREVFRL